MEDLKFVKEGKGYAVYKDGKFVLWLRGSKKGAMKHYKKYLS